MELVARDIKQMGAYLARAISYKGVEYEPLVHDLTDEQIAMYDVASEGWQVVLKNIEDAIEVLMPGAKKKDIGKKKGQLKGAFWGAHQRFFNQLLTSFQMPTAIKQIEKDINAGRSVVIQLVNTNAAPQERAIKGMKQGQTLDDIDITPRKIIIDLVERTFPIHQLEEVHNTCLLYTSPSPRDS